MFIVCGVLVVMLWGCGRGNGNDNGKHPPSGFAFGVFTAFSFTELAPYMIAMGLDAQGYEDWAGARWVI